MKAFSRVLVITVVAALVLTSASVALAMSDRITMTHPGFGEGDLVPLTPNAITQAPGYRAVDTCVNVGCHSAQAAQVDNNHGMAMRPITSATSSVWTMSPYTDELPAWADFKFGLQDSVETTASWAFGGMSIGAEFYIYQDQTGAFDKPAFGNAIWFMDYNKSLPRGSYVPGYNNQSAITTAYAGFLSGVNPFSGSTNATPAADEVACVRCHSFGSNIVTDVDGTPTNYRVQEWGVTCINCHGNNVAITHAPDNDIPFASDVCYSCHNRTPFAQDGYNPARTQQIPMEVWANGAAKNNYMQGYELRESPERSAHFDAAGALSSSRPQVCYRCHDAKGYMAHAQNGSDAPYFYTAATGLGFIRQFPVTAATKSGVDCSVCHTVHDDEQGLNQFGNRIPPLMDYDEGGPTDPAWRQCSDCHRIRVYQGTSSAPIYSFLGYGETLPLDANLRNGLVHGYGLREVFLGYGGYGASQVKSTHEAAGVWCQYCHMPNSVAEPTADRSHLFKIVEPAETYSTSTMDYDVYPGSADGTTEPSATETGNFPDDSCTGAGCHLPTAYDIEQKGMDLAQDDVKAFLQERLDYWQNTTSDLIDTALAAQAAVPTSERSTAAYKMASLNLALIMSDESLGAHNFNYAHQLLDWSIGTFEDIPIADATDMSIAVSNTIPDYNGNVTVSGDLTSGGLPVSGSQVVKLQSRNPNETSGWTTIIELGSSTGHFQYTVTGVTGLLEFQWVYEGRSGEYLPTVSDTDSVKAKVALGKATPNGATTIPLNRNVWFSGTLAPRYPAGQVNVWVQWSRKVGNTWQDFTQSLSATNSNFEDKSKYGRNMRFTVRSPYRTRAVFRETPNNSQTYSGEFRFFAK